MGGHHRSREVGSNSRRGAHGGSLVPRSFPPLALGTIVHYCVATTAVVTDQCTELSGGHLYCTAQLHGEAAHHSASSKSSMIQCLCVSRQPQAPVHGDDQPHMYCQLDQCLLCTDAAMDWFSTVVRRRATILACPCRRCYVACIYIGNTHAHARTRVHTHAHARARTHAHAHARTTVVHDQRP